MTCDRHLIAATNVKDSTKEN